MKKFFVLCLTLLAAFAVAAAAGTGDGYILRRSKGNPRNSEGSFVKLADGTIYFIYTRYNGSSSSDHASADLAAVTSADQGKSWSKPFIVLKNRAMNIMSPSLLRLNDGRIALTYLEKSAISGKNILLTAVRKSFFPTTNAVPGASRWRSPMCRQPILSSTTTGWCSLKAAD